MRFTLPLFTSDDFKVLKRLDIEGRRQGDCAPSVCNSPKTSYKQNGIAFLEIDARDDRSFPLLKECLSGCSQFITAQPRCRQRGVGPLHELRVNRIDARDLGVAEGTICAVKLEEARTIFELFAECVAAHNASPCHLAEPFVPITALRIGPKEWRLYEPDEAAVTRGLLYQPPSPPGSNEKTIEWPRASDEAVAAMVAAAEAAAAETEAVQQAPSSPVASRPHKSPSTARQSWSKVEYECLQDSARPDAVSLL